jgi:putative Mn2+ efflux pump MntP
VSRALLVGPADEGSSDDMIGSLILLGFGLSLDNFRTAVVLGTIRLSWRRATKVALVFGFWDGVAPVVGILVGDYLGEKIGSTADTVGASALAAYGVYLVVQAWRTPEPEEPDQRWALFGLPLPLSLDNIVAGTSLGLLGYSPWLAPPLFGVITFVMSLVGLQLGRAAARLVRIRSDLVTGVALVVMAVLVQRGGARLKEDWSVSRGRSSAAHQRGDQQPGRQQRQAGAGHALGVLADLLADAFPETHPQPRDREGLNGDQGDHRNDGEAQQPDGEADGDLVEAGRDGEHDERDTASDQHAAGRVLTFGLTQHVDREREQDGDRHIFTGLADRRHRSPDRDPDEGRHGLRGGEHHPPACTPSRRRTADGERGRYGKRLQGQRQDERDDLDQHSVLSVARRRGYRLVSWQHG